MALERVSLWSNIEISLVWYFTHVNEEPMVKAFINNN